MRRALFVMAIVSLVLLFAAVPVFSRGSTEAAPGPGETVVEGEPPRFASLVETNQLPPVAERIGSNPLVIEPVERIGQYGGIARVPVVGNPRVPWTFVMGEGLLRWDTSLSDLRPNVATGWEMSADGREFTFFLREGIRWSDGEPFTSADIDFWWNEVATDARFYPDGFLDRRAFFQGGWMEVEAPNPTTVIFRFPEPNPLFPNHMGHQRGWYPLLAPRHYMSRFHPDYASEADINRRLQEVGYTELQDYVRAMTLMWFGMPDQIDRNFPTLNAFRVREITETTAHLDANPFYWKTDTAGNQLPYIDGIISEAVTDGTVLETQILTGQVDYYSGWDTSLSNMPTYTQYQEIGNYRVILYDSTEQSISFGFQLAYQDPVLREIFQDRRFRQAMSLGINRDEINEVFFFGLGQPSQMTVHETSAVFEPRFAQAFANYDPARANRLLDEMGLDRRDSAGYRLRPDGQRLRIVADLTNDAHIAYFELIEEYWEDLGVDLEIRPISNELRNQRITAGQVQLRGPGGIDRTSDTLFFIDSHWFAPNIGRPQGNQGWLGPVEGGWELMPPEVVELVDLRVAMEQALEESVRHDYARRILEAQAENIWRMSIIGPHPKEVFVRQNLRNVPEEGFWGFDGFWAYTHLVEQFFFDN